MVMDTVVVLDRVELGADPPYYVYGWTTCVGGCGCQVWLGSQTVGVVSRGEAQPICQPCMTQAIKATQEAGETSPTRVGQLTDDRVARSD